MLLPHNKVSGGVQDSQIMIPSFFDRFYVMPPLTNGVHYKTKHSSNGFSINRRFGTRQKNHNDIIYVQHNKFVCWNLQVVAVDVKSDESGEEIEQFAWVESDGKTSEKCCCYLNV